MQRGLGVRYGLDQGHVRVQNVLQDVLGVACAPNAQQLGGRPLVFNLFPEVREHLHGVLEGIALRELITLHHDLALFAQEDSLGGRGAAVDAHEGLDVLAGLELPGDEFLGLVAVLEVSQLVLGLVERRAAPLFFLFQAAHVDVPLELLVALVDPNVRVLIDPVADAAEGGKVLRVFRHLDEVLGIGGLRQRVIALLPHFGDVVLPAIAHACDVGVRSAQEQDHGAQRVPARQDRQVLLDDGFKQRRHQLARWDAGFLQAVDIGLGKHAALPCHRVQLQPVVTHLAQVFGRDAQLGVDLVNDGASSSGALVIHGRDLLFAAGLGVFLEDDDLGVLPAQLDHGTALGIQVLDRQRDRIHFLHELGANVRGDAATTRARDEDASLTGLDARVRFHALQELQAFFRLLRIVALVIAPQHLLGLQVNHHGLHRG